jgi:hypothetical protein
MSVRELIQKLQRHSPDDEVEVAVEFGGETAETDIKDVFVPCGSSHLSIVAEELHPIVDVSVTF